MIATDGGKASTNAVNKLVKRVHEDQPEASITRDIGVSEFTLRDFLV